MILYKKRTASEQRRSEHTNNFIRVHETGKTSAGTLQANLLPKFLKRHLKIERQKGDRKVFHQPEKMCYSRKMKKLSLLRTRKSR